MNSKKTGKKRHFGFIFTIIVNVAVVGYIIAAELRKDAGAFQKIALIDIKFLYLLAGILCFGIALLTEYIKYHKILTACNGKSDKSGAFHVAVLGKYYDNITPLGAGGQPFQINYLVKRGHSAGTSAATPIVGFLFQQIGFIIIALVVFIFNHNPSVIKDITGIRIMSYIGLAFYLFVPAMILFFVLLPKPFQKMVGWITKLLGKMHIIKDVKKAEASVYNSIEEYIKSIKLLGKRPFLIAKLIFLSLIYQFAILSIPFFMLRAFGGVDDWATIFSLTVYIYTAITIIPTPGNAGAAEFSFNRVFESLEGGYLFWAMIVWRILVYYSWIILGFIFVIRNAIVKSRAKKSPSGAVASENDAWSESNKTPVKRDGPLSVVFFNDIYFPSVDGVVRTIDAYCREMRAAGHKIAVVVPIVKKNYTEKGDYPVMRTRALRIPFLAFRVPLPFTTKEIKRYFAENRVDVIHVHSPFAMGKLAVKLGKKYNIPVVNTFHSKYYDDVVHISHSRLIGKFAVNLIVNFYCTVDKMWACSSGAAQTLRSYGYNGDIDVMINGVEKMPAMNTEEVKNSVAERFSIPKDKRILLFVGQQIWHKNLRLVLDTAKALRDADPNVVTVIVGEGYDADSIKKYAEKIGVDDKVIFTGAVNDRELLFGIYMLSDLLFFPSVYDNAPLVLREAALAGVPSLLVKDSNAAEVVEDGVNGFVAENNVDAMTEKVRYILSLENLPQIGENAKNTIPVTWDKIAEQVIEKYRNDLG